MIENTGIDFLLLNKNEKAEVIFEMVDQIMKETSLPKEVVIAIVANYKKYSVFQIEQYLKIANPKFYYYAAYYQDGKLIQTQQIDKSIFKIIKEKLTDVILQHPEEVNNIISFVSTTIKNYYESINWLDISHVNVNMVNNLE